MNSQNNGGPAFPDGSTNEWGNSNNSGMTLRDYFAAQAMQGMLANGRRIEGDDAISKRAQYAYLMADTMLAAREVA